MALKPHPTKPDTFVFEGTRPYKKEWVGLTDEEMSELANKYKHIETGWRHDMDLIAEVEAKLKEKNGG